MAGSDVVSPDRRGFGRNLCWLLLAVVGAAGLAACVPAPPPPSPATDCTTTWKGAAGADFGVAANWSKNAVPGATDVACSVAGSSIVVTGTHQVRALRALGSVEVQAGAQLTLETASEVDVLVQDGLVTGPATVEVGRLDWSAGGFDSGVVVRVGDGVGDPSVVDGAVDLCGEATVAVLGELDVAAGAAVTTTACAPGADPLVQVADGATLRATGTGELGVPVQLDGALTVDDGATLDLATAPTMVSSSSIRLGGAGATLRLTTGTGNLALGEGRLTGVGTLDGSVSGPGSVSPTPDAVLHVTGSVAADATVVLELPFSSPAPQKPGRLTVDGAADLSSTTVMASFGAESNLATKTFTVASGAPLTSTGTQLSLPEGLGIGGRLVQVGDELRLDLNHCDPATFHPMVTVPQSLTGKDLSGCDLRGALFTNVSAGSTDFTGSRLDGITVNNPSFAFADFTDASLRGAIGFGANPATWDNTICPDGTNSDDNGDTCLGHFGSGVLQVNTTADTVDLAPGDGVCATGAMVGATPACSLRAAVMESNALPGFDVVWLAPAPLTLTGSLADEADAAVGDLDVTDSLFVRRQTYGYLDPPVSILGVGVERIFDVAPGAELMLDAVELGGGALDQLRNAGTAYLGRLAQPYVKVHAGDGIGITNTTTGSLVTTFALLDGNASATAIESTGRLEILDATVTVPITSTGVLHIDDGSYTGVAGRSTITSTGSAVIDDASIAGGAIGIDATGDVRIDRLAAGGVDTAVRVDGVLVMTSATLDGDAGVGVGVQFVDGEAAIDGSTIAGFGTGIALDAGTAVLTDSVVEANGVGVLAAAPTVLETSQLRDNGVGAVLGDSSTLHRSTVSASTGDGVRTTGAVHIDRSTISGNAGTGVASVGGFTEVTDSTITDNGSGIDPGPDSVAVAGTIVGEQRGGGPDCVGPITSEGWNLDSDDSCGLGVSGDLSGVAPALSGLFSGLGAGPVHVPLEGSPAIDAGRPDCAWPDQHGLDGPMDGDGDGTPRCEIGAVEMGSSGGLDLVVNSTVNAHDVRPGDGICDSGTAGLCTLPAALDESTLSVGADTIRLNSGTHHGGAVGPGSIEIIGPGTIDGLTIAFDGPVVLRNLTIRQLDNLRGDVTLRDVTVNSSGQTGITNLATLHAERVQISSKQVGLRNGAGATAHLERSLIRANTAGGIVNDGTLDLVDSTLTDNGVAGIAGAGVTEVSGSVIERQRSGAPSCAGPVTSAGFNVTSDDTCGLSDPTDVVITTGVLVPQDAPKAFTPITGTAAVDTGRPDCGPAFDGTAAADGDGDGEGRCDRGAFEVGTPIALDLVVNDTADAPDANVGDGVCQTAVVGHCTLRAAVQEANTVPGVDRIVLSPGATYPVPVSGTDDDVAAKGDLDIWGPVRIEGNGATIGQSTNPAAGDLFHVRAGEGIEVDGVTVRNLLRGIHNEGGLTLRGVTVTGMWSIIDSSGVVDIDGLTATGNAVPGAAITNSGSMVLHDATVRGWASSLVNTGSADVERVDLAGGLANTGTLTARSAIVTSSESSVGVVANAGATTTMEESVVSGGLYGVSAQAGSTTTIVSTTLEGSAAAVSGPGAVTATNSLLASRTGPACTAPITSGGYNAASGLTCGLTQPTDRSAVGLALISPQPVPEHPASTLPMAIPEVVDGGYPGCATVDLFGRPRTDSDGDGVIECERGPVEVGSYQPRTYTVNSTVDAVDVTPGDGICETATAGQCTLRAAVTEANLAVGADTITLQALQTYRLDAAPTAGGELYSGDLDVWTSLTLRGSLAGIRDGAVDIHGGAVTIRDLYGVSTSLSQQGGMLNLERYRWSNGAVGVNGSATVMDSTVTDGSLGVSERGSATVTRTPFNGAGGSPVIDNAGTLSMSQSVLALPFDPDGLLVRGTGSTSLDRVTIDTQDVAIEQQGAATVTMIDSTIRGRVVGTVPEAITATNTVLAARLDTTGVCTVALASGGWNLTDDPSGCGLGGPTDLHVADAQMGPLQSNGGSMQSVLPMPGSAAIDSGRSGCTTPDQRGKVRPVDGDADGTATCDRGANELGAVQPLTLTVTSTGDGGDANPGDGLCRTSGSVCTFRAAVMESNASNGPDTIVMTATPWLTQGQMAIGSELVIEGGGQAVYGGMGTSWLDIVTARPVTIRDLNLYDMNPYQALVNHRGALTLHNVTVTYYVVITKGGSLIVEAGSDLADISGRTVSNPDGSGPSRPAVTVTDSTVAEVDAPGSLLVERSTLESIWFTGTTGSIATSTIGKGNWGTAVGVASGTVSIVDSTLWSYQGSPYPDTLRNAGGSVSLTNSITTGCTGSIVSGGYNLGCGSDPTDIVGVALLLGSLGDNGGPTQTFLPDATSPAVDSGAPTCGPVDQRGLPRPVGAACDRGAVERQ